MCRSCRRSAPQLGAASPTATASSWSIRSTAPRNSSPAATNTPSTSRWSTDGKPVLGIVAAPALGLIWRGMSAAAPNGCVQGRRRTPREPSRSTPGRIRPRGARSRPSAARICDPRTEAFIAAAPARPATSLRLGAQVLPGRRRRRRHLSPPLADLRMGRRGRPRGRDGGGRQRDRQPDGAPLRLRRSARRFLVPDFIAWGDPAAGSTRAQ